MEINSGACCGVGEINGLSEFKGKKDGGLAAFWGIIEQLLYDAGVSSDTIDLEEYDENGGRNYIPASAWKDHATDVKHAIGYAHLFFTQADEKRGKYSGYGFNLEQYIIDQGLGDVVVSNSSKNGGTGNYITLFVWTPDKKAVAAHYVALVRAEYEKENPPQKKSTRKRTSNVG